VHRKLATDKLDAANARQRGQRFHLRPRPRRRFGTVHDQNRSRRARSRNTPRSAIGSSRPVTNRTEAKRAPGARVTASFSRSREPLRNDTAN
jgi:hypothetical protein